MGFYLGLGSWLVCGVLAGVFFGPLPGLLIGLLAGLFVALKDGLPFGRSASIQPVEALTWSWKSRDARPFFFGLKRKLMLGLLGGLFFGPSVALFYGPVTGLLAGLYFSLVLALLAGLSKNQLTDRPRVSPNEGIQRSLRNGLLVALLSALITGPLAGLEIGMFYTRFNGLLIGLFVGLCTFFLGGMSYGLGAVIQHLILRFWLWKSKTFPWHAVRFLDDATTRVLLRRVGGGYSFTHRLLMDYFVDEATGSNSTPAR